MKNLPLLAALLLLTFFSCRQAANTDEITTLKSKLAFAESQLEALKTPEKEQLVHVVYFKTKEGTEKDLIQEIKKLEAIEVLSDLEVGTFQDLGDARAMSEFGVVMQMNFDNEAAYKTYQTHPIHLDLKAFAKNSGVLLEPPVTYDYWTK